MARVRQWLRRAAITGRSAVIALLLLHAASPSRVYADTFEECLASVVPDCEGTIGGYLDDLCECVNSANPEWKFTEGDCTFTTNQISAAINRFETACQGSTPCATDPLGCDRCVSLKNALDADGNLTNAQKNEILRRARCPGRYPPDGGDDDYVPQPPPKLPTPIIGDPIIPGQPRRSALGLAVQDNPFGVPGDRAPTVAGIDADRGAFEPVIVDLSFPATGFPWVVGRSYSSQQVEPDGDAYVHMDAEEYQGVNWRQISQPRLVVVAPESGTNIGRIELSLQNNLVLTFIQAEASSPIYKSTGDQSGAVIYDGTAGTYTYFDQRGMQMVFLDGAVSPSTSRYQLWKMIDPAGNTAYVGEDGSKSSCASDGYTADGFLQEVHDASGRRYFYEYSSSAIGVMKRLETVTAAVYVDSSWVPVGWVEYEYYDSVATDKGRPGDLKLVSVTIPTSATSGGGSVNLTRRTYYRYYTETWSSDPFRPGYAHSLKFVLEPEGVRKFDPTGTSFESAADSALSSYAANYFEYEQRSSATNPIRRISKTFTSGDCGCSGSTGNGTYQFAYTNNYAGAADFQSPFAYAADWVTRTAVTRPDSTVVYHYFDAQGLPLREVTKVTVSSTDYYWVQEMTRGLNSGLVSEILTPAAVDSFNPSTHEVTLRASVGLAQKYTYTSVDGGRFVIDTMVKQGTGTTDLALQSTTEYTGIAYKAGGLSSDDALIRRAFVAHTWAYDTETTTAARHGVTPPSGAHETTTSYEFWEESDNTDPLYVVPKVITTTLPKVKAEHHGAGDGGGDPAVQSKAYLRKDGTTAFTQRAAYTTRTGPVLTYTLYENGLVTRQIVDPNEDQDGLIDDDDETDFGLTLPAATVGVGVVNEYTYDQQGRASRTTMYKGSDDERDTLIFYTRLEDQRMVTLSVPKVTGTPITSYMGPVSYTVSLHNGRASAGATLGLSGTGGTTTTDINSWISLTADDELAAVNSSVAAVSGLSTTLYNNAGGKPVQSRTYFDLTMTWPGVDGTDYDQTEYEYDGMGRVVKTTDPTDTVNETVYDGLGRVIARRIGTTTSGSVRTVERMAYDGAALGAITAGGNSFLTKTQQIPFPVADTDSSPPVGNADSDGDPFNDTRITEMIYDFRGRTKMVKNPVSPHLVTKYDNRNRTIATATYSDVTGFDEDTDPVTEDDDRLSLSTSAYDARGQMFSGADFEIDQTDGSIRQDGSSNDIVIRSLNWFNAAGQVIQTRGASFAKHAYDRLGRRTHTWALAKSDDDTGTLDYSEVLTISTDKTSVAGDEVLDESQTGYEPITGRVLVSATIERHHDDAIGSGGGAAGSLEDNDDQDPTKRLSFVAADLKGRIQISANWYDELLRPTTSASYGTNGGSNYTYSTTAPTVSSSSVLVTKREYDKFGRAFKSFDAEGHETRSEYDDAGRTTVVLANPPSGSPDVDQTRTVYVYEDGLQKEMWVDANHNGSFDSGTDQRTTYIYGVSTADSPGPSAINANNLLRKVTYPPQMDSATNEVISAYNALGQAVYDKDQAGIVLLTSYDKGGREVHRRTENNSTDVASKGFDTRVLRMSTTYTDRGLVEKMSQYDNPAIGSGTIKDEVEYEYDHAGMLETISQDADSAIGASGLATRVVGLTYGYSGLAASGGGRDAYRLEQISYPDSSALVSYAYNGTLNAAAGRVSSVVIGSSFLTSYRYNGAARLIENRLLGVGAYTGGGSPLQLGVVNSLDDWESGNYRTYPHIDRFDRIIRDRWVMDCDAGQSSFDPAYYDIEIKTPGGSAGDGYDHNSNIVGITDNRWSQFTYSYTVDRLDRLVDATATGASNPREQFTMDRLGNFTNMLFDANSNGTLTDASDLDDCRTHTQSNEIATRDFTCNSSTDRSPKYNAVGELASDDTLASGNGFKYTWDVFGRLTKIETNASTPVTVAEFQYDARNHRTAWRHPQAGGGGSAPEAQWFYPVYDHRWRMIAIERALSGGGVEWHERFYYHNAGLDGEGGSHYIDAVFRRDRDANLDGSAGDGVEETRSYLQNWRGDVVCMVRPDGWVDERYRYSAYGRPFNIQAGDYNASGYVSVQDVFDFLADRANGYPQADHNFTGAVTVQDIYDYLADYYDGNNITTGNGWDTLSRSDRGNRKGYAGYEGLATPLASSGTGDVAPSMWLARHRWYRAGTGAWASRDPAGIIDGETLYQYVAALPMVAIDPSGLISSSMTGAPACSTCHQTAGSRDPALANIQNQPLAGNSPVSIIPLGEIPQTWRPVSCLGRVDGYMVRTCSRLCDRRKGDFQVRCFENASGALQIVCGCKYRKSLCDPATDKQLDDDVGKWCKRKGFEYSCSWEDDCDELSDKITANRKCLAARKRRDYQCWGNGDVDHALQRWQVQRTLTECQAIHFMKCAVWKRWLEPYL